MSIKTEADVRTAIIAAITASQANLTTRVGSVVRDALINPAAYEFGNIYSELDNISDGQSIWTARGDQVFELAKNYLIYQLSEFKAYGTVYFFSSTEPTGDITIPIGTYVTTNVDSSGNILRFVTLQSVTLSYVNRAAYYDATRAVWKIPALVIAENSGTEYNVAVNTIKLVNSSIPGVSGVFNETAMDGGAAAESEASVVNRVTNKLSGVNIGTDSGYLEQVLTVTGVQDAVVVGPRNVNMTRKSVGGIDIYVIGNLPVSVTGESYSFTTTNIPDFVVNYRPVITTTPGVLISTGGGALVYGTDWEWLKDTTSVLQNSVRALDKVHWLISQPSSIGSLSLTYAYNGLVENVQSFLESDSQKALTADVLVKWASPIEISVTCEIRVLDNYNSDTVKTSVENALTELLNGYYLGQEVQQSDILTAINAVEGVYDVKSSGTSLVITSDPVIIPDAYNNITIPAYSYAVSATTHTVNIRNT